MSDPEVGWPALEARLAAARARATAMGGPQRRERLQAAGKLDALARVLALVDPGSWRELGTFAGLMIDHPRDGYVAGHATIDGRPVLVGSEDPTVAGGSIGLAGLAKRARLAELAAAHRTPLVLMLDGAGHRVTTTPERRSPAPTDLARLAAATAVVPTIAIVHGPSAGHGALSAPLCDAVVMVRGQSQLFIAGPPLVEAATGERIDKETLGGAAIHLASGVAHLGASNDLDALGLARRLLSYLRGVPGGAAEPVGRLTAAIPADQRRPYDVLGAINAIVDGDSTIELSAAHAPELVTALARLGGRVVAVVANQPAVLGGALTAAAAHKGAAFVTLADRRGLPLLMLADTPGVLPGAAAERSGALAAGAAMFAAVHRHRGPLLHVTLRKAFGFGSSLMGQNPGAGQLVTLALPDAAVGAMGARGASAVAGLDDADAGRLADLERSGPWRLADTMSYDEVVGPDDLRSALLDALRLAPPG
jgi:acetyl-CoA carboxylase carboxyltransferase component